MLMLNTDPHCSSTEAYNYNKLPVNVFDRLSNITSMRKVLFHACLPKGARTFLV